MAPNHQTRWIRMGTPLMAIALLSTAPHFVAAQAQAPQKATSELQQLKDQLQQVDEVMQELKGQINALEQVQDAGGSITHVPTEASASAGSEQRGQSPAPKAIEATYSAKADPPATYGLVYGDGKSATPLLARSETRQKPAETHRVRTEVGRCRRKSILAS
jgi:hypothetical protein